MPTLQEFRPQLTTLLTELDRRRKITKKLAKYDEGGCSIPDAVIQARLTTAYKLLMGMAETPWGSLVVDSVQDKLEAAGIRSGDKAADDAVWGLWQDNCMDAESKLGHRATLLDGRSFATVWPDENGDTEIVLDAADQMVVMYHEGSRRRRVAAARHWVDVDDRQHCTLYRRDGLFKFSEAKEKTRGEGRFKANDVWWERREEPDENWPVENPYDVVPVVEYAVNRKLKAGPFGYARGEFEHCTGLIDRINLLTFLGLVVALWMGFPLRGVIGEKILRDDDNNIIPPFDMKPNELAQLEKPDVKTFEFKAADRSNLGIFAELAQFAYITKTPAHYFPLEQGISNISAETVNALEGGQDAKVTGHKGFLGESHEETLRIGALMLDNPVELSRRAELLWKDHKAHSMAERADAATKLKDVLPWQIIAERYLNMTQDEIVRAEAMGAGGALAKLLEGVAAGGTAEQ